MLKLPRLSKWANLAPTEVYNLVYLAFLHKNVCHTASRPHPALIPAHLCWSVKLVASSCFKHDNSINKPRVLEQEFIVVNIFSVGVFRIVFAKQNNSNWSGLIPVNQIIELIMNRNGTRTLETMSIFFQNFCTRKTSFLSIFGFLKPKEIKRTCGLRL